MKRNNYLFLLLLLLFASCNFRVYTNGKLAYKKWPSSSDWNEGIDSLIVFGENDKVPDEAVLISDTKLLSPFFWIDGYMAGYPMIYLARRETKRLGGNIIKITRKRVAKLTRYKLYAKIYSLREPFLSEYRKKEDSMDKATKELNKNLCVVHLKSDYAYFGKCPVFFNDSIAGYMKGFSVHKGNVTRPTLDIKSSSGGFLFISFNKKPNKRNMALYKQRGINLATGEEYYFLINIPYSRYSRNPYFNVHIVPVTKERYENLEKYGL